MPCPPPWRLSPDAPEGVNSYGNRLGTIKRIPDSRILAIGINRQEAEPDLSGTAVALKLVEFVTRCDDSEETLGSCPVLSRRGRRPLALVRSGG